MRNLWTVPLLGVMLTLGCGVAAAQCSEPMDAAVGHFEGVGGNVFLCPTSPNHGSPPCVIRYRYYTDDPASQVNWNPTADGNPVYLAQYAQGSYRTDMENTANFYGGSPHPCGIEMFNIWDAELDPELGDHRGYYGAQSQVIMQGETGNIFGGCGGTRQISCFCVLDSTHPDDKHDPTNTPQGTIPELGGLAAIPVPVVQSTAGASGSVTLTWSDPNNWRKTGEIGGDPGTAKNPIQGVHLFLYESTDWLDSRTVTAAELDANAEHYGSYPVGTTSTTIHCCDLDPSTKTYIPVIKMGYVDSGTGAGVESLYWSANGPVIACVPLGTEVTDFEAALLGKHRGLMHTEVSWVTTMEDGTIGFFLHRATSMEGPWFPVGGFIHPKGTGGEGASYLVEDEFRARGGKTVYYRLTYLDATIGVGVIGPIRLDL